MINLVIPMGLAVLDLRRLFLVSEKFTVVKINNLAKNVPMICIKLCAAGIFGCRICICSI